MDLHGISIVVPVYRSTNSLFELVRRIDKTFAAGTDYEVILVDDGSPAETWRVVTQICEDNVKVRGLRLSRNFGQHSALVAGIRSATFPITVTLDDDLQNPPEEIPNLIGMLQAEDLDLVYGVPRRVEQSVHRRVAGRLTRSALKSGLGVDVAPNVSSFRAFRTRLRDAFANDLGSNVSLDALLTWGGARFGSVAVQHDARGEGTSNFTFVKLMRFAIDTTTGYSTLPLQAASILGFATAAFGLAVLIFVVARPLLTGDSVPGFPFLAATIAIFSGVQLVTLGIIGEYLARMHFRIMGKPTYIVSATAGTDLPIHGVPE